MKDSRCQMARVFEFLLIRLPLIMALSRRYVCCPARVYIDRLSTVHPLLIMSASCWLILRFRSHTVFFGVFILHVNSLWATHRLRASNALRKQYTASKKKKYVMFAWLVHLTGSLTSWCLRKLLARSLRVARTPTFVLRWSTVRDI